MGVCRLIRAMPEKSDTPDRRAAYRAGRQHGIITIAQLREAGLSDDAVSERVRRGWLRRLHRGVYAVGNPRPTLEGWWTAAVFACGDGAVLSHRSAAVLWGLLPRSAASGRGIDVSVPTTAGRRKHRGVRLRRRRSLDAHVRTKRNGIPVTNPAQTIHDLRGEATAAELRRAVRKAEVLGLRTELAPRAAPTRSDLEDLFLELCERYGFPAPDVNREIAEHEVDFSWPDLKVAVETDSHRFHRGAEAFENDHERDLDLRAAGYDVVRLTWRQLTHGPDRCASAVEDALTAAGRAREPALRRGRRGGRGRAGRRRGTSAG